MIKRIITKNKNYQQEIFSFLNSDFSVNEKIEETVKQIISQIKKEGDQKLYELTEKFDNLKINSQNIKITNSKIDQAYKNVDSKIIQALELAAKRITSYHEKIMPKDIIYSDETGTKLGNLWRAIDTAGIYVPGGLATYPSSVLMNAIPAKVAGVKKIIMVVPTPNGIINNIVLAAAKIANIDEIYTIGGAQAIAALALGTQSIPKVDMIAGPGNIYVATAKKILFGNVGIDMIAGPSEILVACDSNNNPDWVAADMLSQAEHDPVARPILVTNSQEFANDVENSLDELLPKLSKQDIAKNSLNNNGVFVITENIEQIIDVINIVAPEHLELCFENANEYIDKINNAGAIFVGKYTPEAIGDYIAGPSHVLPTAGTAKFSSGLSVYSFLKRVSLIECSKESFFDNLASPSELLANEEGLSAHALSVQIRRNDNE